MAVTVVVPTLGASPLLGECLRALREQSADGERPRLVVVVQGESGRRALDLQVGEGGENLADRVLRLPRNVGFAAATNRGLAVADGPWVATVNDDVVVAEGWLAALVAALEADSEAAAAQGVNLQGRPEDGEATVDGWGLDWNRALQAVQLGRDRPAPDPSDPPFPVFGVSATAAVYRRDALLQVARSAPDGGDDPDALGAGPEVFDTRLESYYEDADLAGRLRRAGFTALSVPAARAFHAGSVTGRSLGSRRWRLLYGNRWAVASTLPGKSLWRRAPRMAARDLSDLGRAVVRGEVSRAWGIVGGWRRALRLIPELRGRRRTGGPR